MCPSYLPRQTLPHRSGNAAAKLPLRRSTSLLDSDKMRWGRIRVSYPSRHLQRPGRVIMALAREIGCLAMWGPEARWALRSYTKNWAGS
jgi:hypothetical protein